jgi:uncharacterized protein (DUF302 family)
VSLTAIKLARLQQPNGIPARVLVMPAYAAILSMLSVAKKGQHVIHEFTGRYQVHETSKTFDEVTAALEDAFGSVENEVFRQEVSASKSPSDFESRMRSYEKTSGFMCFHTIDHGEWLAALGSSGRTKMYTIGNPLIARTMIKYNIGVGLNVPIRIAVHEDPETKKVIVSYNLPSSLMSALGNADVSEAAKGLDAKLIALAEKVSGVSA